MAIEQPPVEESSKRPNLATISINLSGDEGIDVSLVDHYLSLGYRYRDKSPSGSVKMDIPRDRAAALHQASIDEHYRRAKGAQRASVGSDVHLVEDKTEVLNPKSAKDFLGTMALDED